MASDRHVTLQPDRREAVIRAIPTWSFSAHDFSDDELLHAASLMLQHALAMPELERWRIPAGVLTRLPLCLPKADRLQKTCTASFWRLDWRTMTLSHITTFDMLSMYCKPYFIFSSSWGHCLPFLQTRIVPLDHPRRSRPCCDRSTLSPS